ncbi:O-succinylbenzoic acid--CoA ligase [Cloacibacterium rupense]|uniref:O-succinylbenzoic acid--CoA ligase n=1 Tax=Cloacibacterium rupense TaxID=517423 RepID=A0ABQ2NS74_9FLAO|nr:AMP-binding protein [Cloacibacterium rupense]GGP05793.1 O-succinylbenzoic acid--CoA ligase [Cloacibacterium rupense]
MQIDFKNFNIENVQPKTEFERKVLEFLQEWFSGSETVSVQTSGSTGIPKTFEIEKKRMLNSAKMTCDFLGLKEGDSAFLCLPVQYISGKMMLVRAIERKLKIIISEPSSAPEIIKKVEFCAMTPLQVQNSLDKIHLIKNLIIGGAAVSEKLKSEISTTLQFSSSPTRIFETYGMSETLSHIALKQISPIQKEYFTILNDVEISVDERNCLRIFAPKLNPEILQTNDIVELLNEKQFKFLGRFDNVINSGGVKIFAEELECFVKKHVDRDLVFLGKPDETLGEKLVLVIEGSEDGNLKSQISNLKFENRFHIPKEVLFLEKFPRAENGKVLRKEILKIFFDTPSKS